jgi:hypothetical protein
MGHLVAARLRDFSSRIVPPAVRLEQRPHISWKISERTVTADPVPRKGLGWPVK